MTLTFTGIALEMTNGDEAQSSLDFTVEVTPVADDFLIVAKDLKLNETGIVLLDLNIRMTDTRGTLPGELTQEILTLTFGSVPTGVNLVAGLGGSLTDNGEGQRVFSGTQDQTNALQMVSGPLTTAGTTDITISGITKDGADILETPITDFFRLTVTRPTNAGILASGNTLTGRDGNDSLTGLAEGNSTIDGGGGIDRIQGLSGFNSLTGGGGSDTFAWNSDDIGLGVDTITDFTVGVGGDQLDFDFVGFDQQLSDISEFLQLLEDGNDTIVRVDSNGVVGGVSFIETVVLQGVTGLDLDQLLADGNLIV
jgi:Ca2+-binding RTX toxin-like protein